MHTVKIERHDGRLGGNAGQRKVGGIRQRGALAPKITASGCSGLQFRFESLPQHGSDIFAAMFAAAPNPAMPATFSVPARGRVPGRRREWCGKRRILANHECADALRSADLVRGERDIVGIKSSAIFPAA